MASGFLIFGAIALVFLLLSLLVPGGWGLPAPAFALIAILAAGPGAFAAWTIYRRHVHRGEVPPLGEGVGEDPDGPGVETRPNAERAERQVGSFRRAAGDEPAS